MPTPDQTNAEVQAELSAARGTVVFAPGLYTKLAGLLINPALVSRIVAHGCKFIMPAAQKKDRRLFSVTTTEPSTFSWEGGEIDMNESFQGRDGYSHEQQAGLFLDGAKGRLTASIQGLWVHHSAGDGVSVYRNSAVSLLGVRLNECFRGGLTVTAGGNEITADHLDARGEKFRSGLRFEPGGTIHTPSTYLLSHVRTNHFNFQLGKGSLVFLLDSIVEPLNPAAMRSTERFQGYVYNAGGKLVIDNCQLRSNMPVYFRLTGDSRVSNCDVRMSRYDAADTPVSMWPFNLEWYHEKSEFNDGQRFTLENTDFSIENADPEKTRLSVLRTFETSPISQTRNAARVNNIRTDGKWFDLFLYGGKQAKTKLIVDGQVQ